jgi:hypothetical protein
MASPPQPSQPPLRPISLEVHRTIETAIGILLIGLPVVLNFPIAGFVLSAGPGALVVSASLAATREGPALTGSSHRHADFVLLGLLILAAFLCAIMLVPVGPAITLAMAAVAEGLLIGTTRYLESEGRDRGTFSGGTRRDRMTGRTGLG